MTDIIDIEIKLRIKFMILLLNKTCHEKNAL